MKVIGAEVSENADISRLAESITNMFCVQIDKIIITENPIAYRGLTR